MISKEIYLKANNSLKKLIEGIPVKDENNEILGWIEKPDVNAIKFVIERYEKEETDANYLFDDVEIIGK